MVLLQQVEKKSILKEANSALEGALVFEYEIEEWQDLRKRLRKVFLCYMRNGQNNEAASLFTFELGVQEEAQMHCDFLVYNKCETQYTYESQFFQKENQNIIVSSEVPLKI